MSCFRASQAIAAIAILLGMSAFAIAQEPLAPSVAEPPVVAPPETKPADLYYLPDAQGKLVPVPGFTWEEFEELLAIQRRDLESQLPPKVVLDDLRVDGVVEGDRAELGVNIEASVNTLDWVAVPLRFDRCVLQEHAAEGCELRMEPTRDGHGFLAWLKVERAGPARIQLKLIKALDRTGKDGALTLQIPRAARAELTLLVKQSDVAAEVPDDEGLVTTAAADQGVTRITVQPVADVVHLAWSSKDIFAPEPPSLEATGQLAVQLAADGIATEARLSLRSTNRPIESVQIRLPRGARLLPERQASYSVELLSQETDDAPAVAEIRLHEPNTVAEVRLQTRQDWPPTERALDLAGFAVVDATRQRGFIALQVSDDLRAQWDERTLVRQVDELPANLRDPAPTAGFEYTGQPFSLLTKVSERVTRLSVEPQYVVTATQDALLLKARLRCRVRDGSLHRLTIQLQDWSLNDESWGPAGLITEPELAPIASDGSLDVPLQRPVTGEFELRFEARRPIPPGASHIAFTLPRPAATTVEPARLVVQAADNVRLTPRPEAQLQLSPQPPEAGVSLPPLRQSPQFFRGDVAQARYEAGFEVRSREVRSAVTAQATWGSASIEVRQRIKYRVDNEPLDRLDLMLPALNVSNGNPRLTLLESEPIPLAWSAAATSTAAPGAIFLPRPLLGEFEVEARFELPMPVGPTWDLPIVQPLNSQDSGCTVELNSDPGLAIKPRSADWRPHSRSATGVSSRWSSRSTPSVAGFEVSRADRGALDQDLVERAWLQTQLVGDQRQDRVVWRVIAADGEITIRLPDAVRARDVLAMLDGVAVVVEPDVRGNLVVFWPASADRNAPHVVELDYRVENLAETSATSLTLPRLASPGRMKQSMWEILLPADEHLLTVPTGYQLDGNWIWQGGYWARQPAWTSDELRRWSGGAARDDMTGNSNRYVLGVWGTPESLELRRGKRSTLVLATSSLLLAAGLLIMFAPPRWRSATLLALTLASVVGLIYAGDLAVLLLQAAAPGLLAVMAAWGLHAWQYRGRGPVLLLQGSTHTKRGSGVIERPASSTALVSHSSRPGMVTVTTGERP